MWLFRHKYLADGTLSHYKAQLVANGSLQYLTFTKPDISYDVQYVCLHMHDPQEPHFSALKRILRYIRGTLDYVLQLFFSSTTDLVPYSDADWVGCPTTRRSTSEYRGVANAVAETCWLRNLLRELHTLLSSATLVYCDNVSAIYLSSNPIQHQRKDTTYLLVYVDDIGLTASSSDLLHRIISSLHQEFAMTDKKYAVEILEHAGMVHCNPSWTPVDTESKMGTTGDVVSDLTLYRSLAGSLQYLTFTKPDISYDVQYVCLHMHDPQEPHFSALKRILRYIRGTLDYVLQLFFSSTTDLVPYSDADWVGCPTTRRSTSEYRGVANAVAETCWLRNLLRELHTLLSSATLVYCDNVSAIYLSSNPIQHQRTKHIEIDIHFVRDLVATGQVRVLQVPSLYQFADIFTKGLPTALFEKFRSSLSVWCLPTQTAGEC
nr:ribonuclease H-like domain-containing protein [Tanacetum cinerariifolium]